MTRTTLGRRCLVLMIGLCLFAMSIGARWWALPQPDSTGTVPIPESGADAPSLQRTRAVLGPPPSGGRWPVSYTHLTLPTTPYV